MNRLTAFIKKIRLGQLLTVFLAGILVFVSTACSGTDVMAGKTSDQIREEVPSEAVTSVYKGGQNQYSDVDPRNPNMTKTEAKAKMLKDEAQRRIDTKASSNVGENVRRVADEAPDKFKQVGEKLNEDVRAAKQNFDEFGKNTQKGIANVKENTREGLKGAKEVVKEATEGAKDRVADGTDSVKYNLKQGKENVKDAFQAVKSNADDVSDKVSSKVNRDIDRTQRAAEKAVDAID
jgi:phage-related protein